MLKPTFFNTIFVSPILNLLVLFYSVFVFLKIPGAFGFSIIALTAFVRLILQPFFHKQMETAKKMQELKPHLDKLSQKHKNDKKRLQQEQLKLYQQKGVNPASGCLFMIIQIPIFIALYNTLSLFLRNGNMSKAIQEINKVLYIPALKIASIDPWFLGFNLATTPQKAGLWHYYLIPLLTGFLQYYQVKVSTPQTPPPQVSQTKDDSGDFQKAMNTQMKYFFPALIAWFSYSLPVGLSLYWNVFSVFSIIQYQKLKTSSLAKATEDKQNSNVKTNG